MFSPLLITFANSLDPGQDQQNDGCELNPNGLILWLCSWKKFLKKVNFEKKSTDHNNVEKLPSLHRNHWFKKKSVWHFPFSSKSLFQNGHHFIKHLPFGYSIENWLIISTHCMQGNFWMLLLNSDSFTNLALWVLGLAVSHINESNCKLMSPEHYFTWQVCNIFASWDSLK